MFWFIEYDVGIKELNNFLISVCADAALRRNLLRIGVVIEPRSSITIHAPFSVSKSCNQIGFVPTGIVCPHKMLYLISMISILGVSNYNAKYLKHSVNIYSNERSSIHKIFVLLYEFSYTQCTYNWLVVFRWCCQTAVFYFHKPFVSRYVVY